MFGKMIGLLDFRVSGFRWEDLIFLQFHIQILSDKMLQPRIMK